MAATQPDSRDQPSPGLTLSLSSNNPFRNRAGSPLPKSPSSPFDDPAPQQPPSSSSRPLSNNPFLDPTKNQHQHQSQNQNQLLIPDLDSPTDKMAEKNRSGSPTIEDMFVRISPTTPPPHLGETHNGVNAAAAAAAAAAHGLSSSNCAGITIDTKDKKPDPPQRPPPMNRAGGPKGENMPPPGRRGPPPPNHRPTRSQEEALRARRQRSNGDGPNSPPRRTGPGSGRGRRNSESSVTERPVLTEEEKRAREKRRREREERKRREGRDKPPRSHRDMDLIDKLDATSIYGTGLFHHSGPYDAVIASRNKAASGRAPMAAFAKDSANMSIGGSGPLQARADHSTFMGNGTDEAFTDYATSISGAPPTKKDMTVFDPHRRASVIHGDETVGLGTSTFLEGTPAARAAVQKAEQESALQNQEGGLARKKSLAQRIRGINRPPRGEFGPSGRLTNPEGAYRDHSTSASMSSARNETNPFFAEYEPGKDGEEQITVRKMSQAGPGSPASPPLPGTLERRSTTDTLEQQPKKSGGGLLTRMKSLKGGPRSRPSDRDAGNA